MKPFNVTLIRPEGTVHVQALLEAAEYLHYAVMRAGYASVLSTNRIYADTHNIVLNGHLLTDRHLEELPADTILFNSEQLVNKDGWYFKGAYRQLIKKFFVWDYSLRNMAEIDHARKFHIPFLFCPELMRAKTPRGNDGLLYFYGIMTERRKRLMQALRDEGVQSEWLFGKYAAERDALIFNAWAVLNISHTEAIGTFEPIRCFYPLINGIPVISETSSDPTYDLYKDYLFTFTARNLARGVAELYRDKAAFEQAAAEKAAAFRATSSADALAKAVAFYRDSLSL